MKFKFSQSNDDLTGLTRESLKGVKVDLSYIDGMTKEEVDSFLVNAYAVMKNPAFKKVLDYLMSEQVDISIKEAGSWEQVLFGRATINGIALIRQEFGALAAMWEDRNKIEEFDKYKVI